MLPPASVSSSPEPVFSATPSSSPHPSSNEATPLAAPAARVPAPSRRQPTPEQPYGAVVVPYPFDVAAYQRAHAAMANAPQAPSFVTTPAADEAREERVCPLCHTRCAGKLAVHAHVNVHEVLGRWPCPVCRRESPTIGALSRHIACHGGWLHYECPHCPATLKGQREKLCRHIDNKHPGHGLAACDEGCNLIFANSHALGQHRDKMHADAGEAKGLGYSQSSAVWEEEEDGDDEDEGNDALPARKRRRRREPRPFTCPHCSFATADPCVLVHHAHTDHAVDGGKGGAGDDAAWPNGAASGADRGGAAGSGEDGAAGALSGPPWNCPRCCYVGISGADLRRHVDRVHSSQPAPTAAAGAAQGKDGMLQWKDGVLHCPHCPYTATKPQALYGHLNRHRPRGTAKCPYCDYVARSKGFLGVHIRNHHPEGDGEEAGDEPPQPSGATRSYTQRDPKERPYPCPHCPYAAKTPGRLTRHKISVHKIDDSERPAFVSCPLCSYTAPSLQRIRVHIAANHMGDSSDVQVQ